jgi:STE24 endopeptidase
MWVSCFRETAGGSGRRLSLAVRYVNANELCVRRLPGTRDHLCRHVRHHPLRWFVLLLAALFVICLPGARASAAVPSYVDHRVTAIPAATLLHRSPQALVDRRRQRVAVQLRRYTRPLFFVWALCQIAALFCLWSSGWAARLRDMLRRSIGSIALVRFVYGAVLAVCAAAAAFPAALIHYRVERAFGLSAETSGTWLHDGIVTVGIQALSVGIVVAFVLALVDRTRLWYLYAMAGLFVATLAMAFLEPAVIAPLYDRFTPLPAQSTLQTPLRALERKAGISAAPIYVGNYSRRSSVAVADISGFGPTKRIVLGDTLLHSATQGEILFVTARELGHYAHGDDFRLSLFWTFLFILCTALGVIAADRVGFRRDDDPLARLALALSFVGLAALLLAPFYNGYSRALEARADGYALELSGDRASAVRSFVRTADESFEPLCTSLPVRLYFYNSPPLGSRIAAVTGRPDPCR